MVESGYLLGVSEKEALERDSLELLELGFNTLIISGEKDLRRRESGPGRRQVVLDATENGDRLGAGLESEIREVEEVGESGSACPDTIVPFPSPIQVALVLPFQNGEKAIFTAEASGQRNRPIFSNPAASNIQLRAMEETVEEALVDGFLPEGRAELNAIEGSSMAEIITEVVGPLSSVDMLEAIEVENSPDQISLLELISSKCLDSRPRSGRPAVLTEVDKDHLVHTVKRNFTTRRMSLVDIRRESGLSHVSNSTVWKVLKQRGIKAYREEFKFILKPENKVIRLAYCNERKLWTIRDWANYGFTDEMSIEVGGLYGLNLVWRDNTE